MAEDDYKPLTYFQNDFACDFYIVEFLRGAVLYQCEPEAGMHDSARETDVL
jgi:hypothetical protein